MHAISLQGKEPARELEVPNVYSLTSSQIEGLNSGPNGFLRIRVIEPQSVLEGFTRKA